MTPESPVTHERVTIIIDHRPYHFDTDRATGLELKQRADIPAANLLFLEVPGPSDDQPISDSEVVHLEPGEHFYDMPPGNFGAAS